jgi:hypothetical protein
MLSINPKAILQLSKLQRAVLRTKGVRYGIAEEKGILELLQYVKENRDEAYNDFYQEFVSVLTPEEKLGLSLVKVSVVTADLPTQTAEPTVETPNMRTFYYRGVKTQIIDDSGTD